MSTSEIKFTYKDYKNLPESETKRYELLEGELVMVPSPTTYHQRISVRLQYILEGFVQKRGLGFVYAAPCDVVLSEETVVQPDIFFISKEHSQIVKEENIQGAPDLIIEILSPATHERDRTYKRTLYAKYGSKEYWLTDPEGQTIEVLTLSETGFNTVGVYGKADVLKSPLLSNLEINLSEIF